MLRGHGRCATAPGRPADGRRAPAAGGALGRLPADRHEQLGPDPGALGLGPADVRARRRRGQRRGRLRAALERLLEPARPRASPQPGRRRPGGRRRRRRGPVQDLCRQHDGAHPAGPDGRAVLAGAPRGRRQPALVRQRRGLPARHRRAALLREQGRRRQHVQVARRPAREQRHPELVHLPGHCPRTLLPPALRPPFAISPLLPSANVSNGASCSPP